MSEDSGVQILEQLIQQALDHSGSDIHWEPMASCMQVRIRRDGILYLAKELNNTLGQQIISRLKILSNLDIAEKRLPQDGHFSMRLKNYKNIDVRVSTCPTCLGEKAVLRVQIEKRTELDLEKLGFEAESLNFFRAALAKTQGMIVVTGPTGSGKTLTLYSALAELDLKKNNICTVEDPVEIPLAGITQVEILPKIGLTFDRVFSAFLRQDPDVLMLGEMRDLDSAKMAMRAAHTGHLVLTTLHTNTALEAVMRLNAMGIENYAIAGALSLLVSQRLVRKLCEFCKKTQGESANGKRIYENNPSGCEYCHEGFNGRVGCFEVIPIDETLRNLIFSGASLSALKNYAQSKNYLFLETAGLQKVNQGLTTPREIISCRQD